MLSNFIGSFFRLNKWLLHIIKRSEQLSLCHGEILELLAIHRYSVDILSHSSPSGISRSGRKQSTN